MLKTKKKALVLAAGIPQAELADKLKTRGYNVIMADYTENPVGKYAADKFYQTSTLDMDAIRQIAIDEEVTLIMTVCTDQAMQTVSKLSEELGLPCYVDYSTALKMTNKKYMKEIFSSNGIPTARHIVTDNKNAEQFKGFEFPLVVKPVDCNSSKGVRKVSNNQELSLALQNAIRLSRTATAVVEEFKAGMELTVDIYVEDGEAKLLTVSMNEKIKSDSTFVIYRTIHPAPGITSELYTKIRQIVQKIVDAYSLKDCPMLMQALYDGEDIWVIEFCARTGGCLKYRLIELTSGVDIVETTIELTLNGKAHVTPIQKDIYVCNEFIYCNKGIFDRAEGFEELKLNKVVENYYFFQPRGTSFEFAESSSDRIGGYTIVGKSRKEITEKHNEILSKVKIISTDGRDIMRRDILKEEKCE